MKMIASCQASNHQHTVVACDPEDVFLELTGGWYDNWEFPKRRKIRCNYGGNKLYFDTMFQRTIIDSLLYERRKNIDKIACSNDIQSNDFDTLTNCINSIQLDDLPLERLLEQTEINMNLILDGTVRGFTNDDVNAVKKIKERFQFTKERFSEYKEDRSGRERILKKNFHGNMILQGT